VFGKPKGVARHDATYRKAATQLGHIGCTLFVAVIATLSLASARAQTQPYSATEGYRSLLQQLHDDPVRPSRMGTGTLLAQQPALPPLAGHEDQNIFRIACAQWKLEVSKRSGSMSITSARTGLVWRLGDSSGKTSSVEWIQSPNQTEPLARVISVDRVHPNQWRMQLALANSGALATLEIGVLSPAVVRLSIRASQSDSESSTLRLHLNGQGPFFGLGERFDRVQLDGLRTTLRPEDLLGKPGHNWTYIPVPFLFTPRGLGLYLDTARVSSFDLSDASRGNLSAQIDDASLDAYLFIGSPQEILESYTALTGPTPVPPAWAYWIWICSYQGPDQVLREARRLREEKIPSSAIWTFDVLDRGDIMGWPLWWTGYYPHPREFTDALHGMGFKVLTYLHPYIRSVLGPYNLPAPAYEAGKRDGLFVLDQQGQPTGPAFEPYRDGNIDFTCPANVDWWEKRIREIVVNQNFDGWMEDYGEWVNDADRFAAGVSGRTMANLNPLFYHRITYEIAHSAKPDIVEFVRSGYAGSQGFTRVVWGGDQFPDWSQDYGLPSVVRAGITAGLSGFGVWGPDIAENGHSLELWTRWVEFGALTPIMRDHPWDRPAGAVNIWHDAETIDTRLHISLYPYFDAYAHQSASTGLPIMRHLLLNYPDDPNTSNVADEYLLGDSILVAPVIAQGATTRSVYLPQGAWTEYWTGKTFDGGKNVTVAAPLRQIPFFVRAGTLLPLIRPETETLASDLAAGKYSTLTGDLTWRPFPSSAPSHSIIILGDGTLAEAIEDRAQIEIKMQYAVQSRRNEVIVPTNVPPRQVLLAGRSLSQADASDVPGWHMDATTHTLHILFQSSNFDLRIQP
jgi:alpha-D-xyloside xylohydrolase